MADRVVIKRNGYGVQIWKSRMQHLLWWGTIYKPAEDGNAPYVAKYIYKQNSYKVAHSAVTYLDEQELQIQ